MACTKALSAMSRLAEGAQQGTQQAKGRQQLKQGDYLRNLEYGNEAIQRHNIQNWDKLRRGKGGKGVEVKKAF